MPTIPPITMNLLGLQAFLFWQHAYFSPHNASKQIYKGSGLYRIQRIRTAHCREAALPHCNSSPATWQPILPWYSNTGAVLTSSLLSKAHTSLAAAVGSKTALFYSTHENQSCFLLERKLEESTGLGKRHFIWTPVWFHIHTWSPKSSSEHSWM